MTNLRSRKSGDTQNFSRSQQRVRVSIRDSEDKRVRVYARNDEQRQKNKIYEGSAMPHVEC